MGILIEKVKLNNLVYGNGIAENYKNNSLYFYDKYKSSDDDVRSIRVGEMQIGGFYFLHYKDDSNWIKYSPIFTISFKKFEDMIIIFAINFNFIPIEVRVSIFDRYIKEDDIEDDKLLNVDYSGVYSELIKYGFEYAICEYNLKQVVLSHKISLETVPRFLYAGHPINKYDPKKIYEIWKAKLSTREKRDQEMSKALISDFYEASDDIMENYDVIRGHINRIKKSYEKYG